MPNRSGAAMTVDAAFPDTRLRLLTKAAELFAAHGYDGVSTRALARAANVNIAAIGYHFGGKKELYAAVIRHAVESTGVIADPIIAGIDAGVAAAGGDRRLLAETAVHFVRGFLRGLGSSPDVRVWMALLQQEFAHPSEAFPIILEGRITPVHRALCALVASVLDRHAEDAATIVRTHAVLGQILMFFLTRAVVLGRTGWSHYGPAEIAVMEAEIVESVLGSLNLSVPSMKEARP